jgi:Domain of unknown function (DUF4192)
MNAPEHLIISGPEDILGYVPHTLGYWPSCSLVAMTMQGKRLGATLRVDLPEGTPSPRGREDFARTVADYLLADKEADGTLLIFFTDDGWSDAAGPPGSRALLADLEPALGLAGMPVRDAWYVGVQYWRNVYCTDAECCPLPGRPLAEIRDSRLNAEMVYLGSSVGEAPGTGPAATAGSGDPAVMEAEGRWAHELCDGRGSREQFETVLDAWQAALAFTSARDTARGFETATGLQASSGCKAGPGPESEAALPCDITGFLRATLCVPAWRDAVLVMAAAGRATALAGAEQFGIFSRPPGLPAKGPSLNGLGNAGLDIGGKGAAGRDPVGHGAAVLAAGEEPGVKAQCPDAGGRDGNPEPPGYGEVLLGLSPAVPDWQAMKLLEDVMLHLVACGPGEAEAAAWTSKGWIEWCRGRGSYAHASLSKALAAAPGYRLAELLSEVVRRGTICGWAGRKEAAWQRFGTDAA